MVDLPHSRHRAGGDDHGGRTTASGENARAMVRQAAARAAAGIPATT